MAERFFWLAVAAVVVSQFALCYDAMTCRGYPPLEEHEILSLYLSPVFAWLPAVFGSQVDRLRGVMVLSVTMTVFLTMVDVNGNVRPSVGSHAGPLGIVQTYFLEILVYTAFYTPFTFVAMYFYERVFGDLWRTVCFQRTERIRFWDVWEQAWTENGSMNAT